MTKEYITKENKKVYQENFANWLEKVYPHLARPDIMASNVMYSINNNMGFSINDLLSGKLTLDEYREKYEEYFEKIGRKSPKGHSHVQKGCAKYFLEFFESTMLNINDDKVKELNPSDLLVTNNEQQKRIRVIDFNKTTDLNNWLDLNQGLDIIDIKFVGHNRKQYTIFVVYKE